MEPLDENELDQLLQLWVAPSAPRSLDEKVLAVRVPWWRRFLNRVIPHRPTVGSGYLKRKKIIRKV
jgi:hypothetical protein